MASVLSKQEDPSTRMLQQTTELKNGGGKTVVSILGADESVQPQGNIPLTQSIIVSHIPRSVSIGSTLASNVSLASDYSNIMRPPTRINDDDAVDVDNGTLAHAEKDSSYESSSLSPTLMESKPTIDTSLSRKISDTDIERKGPAKKARIEPLPRKQSFVAQPLQLLACPDDSMVLNAVHVFVRKQTEVFTATAEDMAQPAPGRKNPIRLHQVGLRCVHCRHLPSKDRVKRAVCYPSSVGRVYHSVSDMKFDHFSHCRGLPNALRVEFDVLKDQCKRGGDRRGCSGNSSSTAQYYHDSALRMGMEDQGEGIFMAGEVSTPIEIVPQTKLVETFLPVLEQEDKQQQKQQNFDVLKKSSTNMASSNLCPPREASSVYSQISLYHQAKLAAFQHAVAHGFTNFQPPVLVADQEQQLQVIAPVLKPSLPPPSSSPQLVSPRPTEARSLNQMSHIILATPSDPQYLNPLHCFVRQNIELFVATEQDINAPSPGRKNRVAVGQVGLRCIHCAKLPIKSRVKRAICYPPSVCGIYHSVSNMKFDHFGSCRGLPPAEREAFGELRSSYNRRGGSTSNGSRGMSNSTAQYYHDSALRLGLTDTTDGIRFCEKANVSDGISALMMAATNSVIRAEYDRMCAAEKATACK